MTNILWAQYFLEAQGNTMNQNKTYTNLPKAKSALSIMEGGTAQKQPNIFIPSISLS